MKEIKQQKGITLIALIITIVVLLILAAVTIGTMQESNIVGMATNAATKYEEAKTNETSLLGGYEAQLEALTAERVVFAVPGVDVKITILPEKGTSLYEAWDENGEKISYTGTFTIETVTEELLDEYADGGMPTSVDAYLCGVAMNFNTPEGTVVLVMLVTENSQEYYIEGTKLTIVTNTASSATMNKAYKEFSNTIGGNAIEGNTIDGNTL